MFGRLHDVGIEALTATVARNRVPVEEVLRDLMSEKKAKRLTRGTGIEALSLAPPAICTSDLCYDSANRLLSVVDRGDIGALIFISQTADYLSPATSYYLQKRLDLSHDILAFDVNLGCSGFCYGVFLAATLLPALGGRKVLICCGDTSSRNVHPEDISMRSIAGDAGAAAVISPRQGHEIYFHIESFGEMADDLLIARGGSRAPRIADEAGMSLCRDNYVVMDGMGVMNFTIDEVPRNIKSLLDFAKLSTSAIDHAVLHQANEMIVRTLAVKIGIPEERVPFFSGRIGNTSSASIPVCLAEMVRTGLYEDGKFLLSGFGVGMSIASLLMDFSQVNVLGTCDL